MQGSLREVSYEEGLILRLQCFSGIQRVIKRSLNMDLNHDHKKKLQTLFIMTMFIMETNYLITIGFHLKDMFLSVQLTTYLGYEEFPQKSS